MLREGVNSSGLAAEWVKLSEEERKARLGGELGGLGGPRGKHVFSQAEELDRMAGQPAYTGGGKPHNLFDQMFAQQRQFQAQDKAAADAKKREEEARRRDEESQRGVEKFNAFLGKPQQNQSKLTDNPTEKDFLNWLRDISTGPNMSPLGGSPVQGWGDDSDELLNLLGWSGGSGNLNAAEGNVVRSEGNLDDGMPPSSASPEEKQRWFGEGGKFWDTKVGNAIEKYGDEGKAIAKVLLGLAFPPAAIPLYISAVKVYARDQAPGTRYSEAQPWMKEKFPRAYAGMYEKDLIPGLAGVQSPYGMFDIASGLLMGRPQDAIEWGSWLYGNRKYFDNYGLGRGQGGTS